MTAREIALALQVSVPHATVTVHRLVQAGALVEVDRVTVEWMKRPAARYAIADPSADATAWSILSRLPATNSSETY